MRHVIMTLSKTIQDTPPGSGSLKISDLCRILNKTEIEVWEEVRSDFLPKPIKTNKGNRWIRDDLRRAELRLPPLGMLTRIRMLEGQS
jgi:hypothetical protein